MDILEFREKLQQSQSKIQIITDRRTLSECEFGFQEFTNAIKEILNDNEKQELLQTDLSKKFNPKHRLELLESIENSSIRVNLLKEAHVTSGFYKDDILNIIKSLKDEDKKQLLYDLKFLEDHGMSRYDIIKIIFTLNDENKKDVLKNKVDSWKLSESEIAKIVSSIESEEIKTEIIGDNDFKPYDLEEILKTFSDETKETIILTNKYNLPKNNLIKIVASINIEPLVDFVKNNKSFLREYGIMVYEITEVLDKQKQLAFFEKLEEMNLSIGEKRLVLATLKKETKDQIDLTELPDEYVTAIAMEISKDFSNLTYFNNLIVDLDKNLEDYRGLDEIMAINALGLSSEQRGKLIELCGICPRMEVRDKMPITRSTGTEYIEGEKWIEFIEKEINPSWTQIQRIAYIDNAIGKRISYSPDFDTEVFNMNDSRALWKIIISGYGVCNGIAQLEAYMLRRQGVEVEEISSGTHAFLKLIGIEIPTADGGTVSGDTLLDPTWNLTAHRYGCIPQNFCKSYESIRKNDIDSDGVDHKSHKNDEVLSGIILDLDEQSLREIFTSIGVADKNGNFPIKALMDQSKGIYEMNLSSEETIKMQLQLLVEYCPEFAICQNSTSSILSGIILKQEKLKFNRCVVNRVYARGDDAKRPILYVYADLLESGKKFYFADSESKQFIEVQQREFEERFECYQMDLEKNGGQRPWEETGLIQNKVEDPENSDDEPTV